MYIYIYIISLANWEAHPFVWTVITMGETTIHF